MIWVVELGPEMVGSWTNFPGRTFFQACTTFRAWTIFQSWTVVQVQKVVQSGKVVHAQKMVRGGGWGRAGRFFPPLTVIIKSFPEISRDYHDYTQAFPLTFSHTQQETLDFD